MKKPQSKYIGVDIDRNGLFRAKIMIDRRLKFLGRFKTEEEAAKAYNKIAVSLGRPTGLRYDR